MLRRAAVACCALVAAASAAAPPSAAARINTYVGARGGAWVDSAHWSAFHVPRFPERAIVTTAVELDNGRVRSTAGVELKGKESVIRLTGKGSVLTVGPTKCDPTETKVSAPTETKDTVCRHRVICTATEFETRPHTATVPRACKTLTVCEGSEYELQPPSPLADRVCASHTRCAADQWESKAPNRTSDRQCTRTSVCTPGYWERAEPTATSDRDCGVHTVCDAATQYETGAPDERHDRVCSEATVCTVDEYEYTAKTAKSDRVCRLITPCSASEYISQKATRNADQLCSSLRVCDRAVEFEARAPTAHSDRVCLAKVGPTSLRHFESHSGCCDPRIHSSADTFCKIQNHRCEKSITRFGTPTYVLVDENAPHACDTPGKCVPCPPSMGVFRSIRVSHAAHKRGLPDVHKHRCAMMSATKCACCDCKNGVVTGLRSEVMAPPTPVPTRAPTPAPSPNLSFFMGLEASP